jgi:hypothetical protein
MGLNSSSIFQQGIIEMRKLLIITQIDFYTVYVTLEIMALHELIGHLKSMHAEIYDAKTSLPAISRYCDN